MKQVLYALVKTRTLTMTPAPESSSEPVIPDVASFVLNRKFSSKRLKVGGKKKKFRFNRFFTGQHQYQLYKQCEEGGEGEQSGN